MDDYIDARFERVEKALASLVESVSKYHPYARQADDLQDADRELSEGLKEVERHQNNHLRLQTLRATSASLDAQIRETLTSLASTRRDITTTHITVDHDGPHYQIKYDQLLNFARRISKTTLPPAGVTNGLPPEGDDQQPSQEQPAAGATGAAPTNGLQSAATSAAPTPTPQPSQQRAQSQTPDQPGLNGVASSSSQPPSEPPATQQQQQTDAASPSGGGGGGSTTRTTLPDGLRDVLNPNFGAHFIPWPNEYQIGGGALAAVQELAESGIDPKGYDPEAVAAEKRRLEEEERAAREEQERRKREEERRRREEWEANAARRQAMDAQRRESAAETGAGTSATGQPKKTQFQFTSILDDDDDDED